MNLLKEEVNKSSNNKDSENTFIVINNNNFNNSGSGSVVHSEIDKNEYNSTTHYHHLKYGDNNLDDNLLMDDLLNSNDLLFNNDNNNDNNRLDLYDHDHGIQNSNSYDNSSSSYHHNNVDYPNFIDGNDGHNHHHDDNNCGDLFPALKECVFDDDFDNFFLDTMNDENSSNHETIDIVNNHHHDNNDFYSNYDYNSVDLDFDVIANSSQALILDDNTDMYYNHMVLSKPADFFENTAIHQQKLSIDDRSGNGSKSSRGKNNSMTKLNTKNHNDKQQQQQQQQQQILLSGKRSFDDSIGEIVVVVYVCNCNLIVCHVFKYVCIYVILI